MKILALSSNDMEYVPSVVGGLPGVEVETLSTSAAPFPATPHNRLEYAQHHVDLVRNHPLDDVDAIFLDTFGDYGVDAVRSVTGLPVFGAGESSLMIAHAMAPRFAIVTVWPESLRYIYAERLQATRTEGGCAGIIHVSKLQESPEAIYADTRDRHGQMRDKVLAAARQAVSDLDVDAVIFGCTCMSGMHEYVQAAVPVPVICAARTGLGFMLGAAACGWRQSSRMVPNDATMAQGGCVVGR
jgi:allantoin racemase